MTGGHDEGHAPLNGYGASSALGPGEAQWYRRWFGEEYLALYPHRDREEARRAVELFVERTGIRSGERVLDLACGAGRHLESLLAGGLDGIGLDLSLPLLRHAARMHPGLRLVRGDMRSLPFRAGAFAAVTSFFTSFGYFDAQAHDRRVLDEIRRVLRPGGWLLLDFLNAQAVIRELTPRDERTIGDRRVVQERKLVRGGRVIEKRIRIEDEPEGGRQEFVERVRLYGPDELEGLLEHAGLRARARFGDYAGGPISPTSPRVILAAERVA